MTVLIKAEYKCPHCGEISKALNHLSENNLNGKGIGKDPFIGKCAKCKKKYNKKESYVKDVKEKVDLGDFETPVFVKAKTKKKKK